tara:strand:- start:5142 stop:6155 length:1014 start_codon:yes stop_codon:yes gene_type:complete
MKKILYVEDRGVNILELTWVLERMKQLNLIDFKKINISTYAHEGESIQKDYDVLIYQTYPHQYHKQKWNGSLINKTDEIFSKFKGYKIFQDGHDSGRVDSFSRFGKESITTPRIKSWPSYESIKKFNTILTTTGGMVQVKPNRRQKFLDDLNDTNKVNEWSQLFPNDKKENNISYIVSYGYHKESSWAADPPTYISQGDGKEFIRENTRDKLNEYKRVKTEMERRSQEAFNQHLSDSLISVTVPGWGEGCLRQYEGPLAGCLNLIHESIADIKLLPHSDLIDGEDFVSFNLDNLHEKLDYIFNNRPKMDAIRFNGKIKLHQGFNLDKSAYQLYEKIK